MGGCKCTFRDCSNSSKTSHGTHFFHYPVKMPERCVKWIRMAGKEDDPSFADPSRVKNKVVCQFHFNDTCFMNFKHESLTKVAVPTIFRLSNTLTLDYELESEEACEKKRKYFRSVMSSAAESDAKAETETPPGSVILNSKLAVPTQTMSYGRSNSSRKRDVKTVYITTPDDLDESSRKSTDIILADLDEIDEEVPEKKRAVIDDDADKITLVPTDKLVKSPLISLEVPSDIKPPDNTPLILKMKSTLEQVQQRVEEMANKIHLQEANCMTVPRQGPQTKLELFNAIQRYLSPTVATIVRMELFGNPEREWLADERELSMDLHSLGDNVYNFIRDEWRFRLPPKADIESWKMMMDRKR